MDKALEYIRKRTPLTVWFIELYGEKMLQTLIAQGKVKETKGRLYAVTK